MKILLTGASGFIGHNLMAVLAKGGHEVVPISRRHGVDIGELRSPGDWMPWVRGVDAAVNAVGIIGETRAQRFETLHTIAPQALFDACQQAGVPRVVQISALGADDAAFSAYHLSKKAADDHLRGLDLNWFILRPAVIYGSGGTSAELFMRLARSPVIPVIGDGRQDMQPVHIADVVATVLACLATSRCHQTFDIVGNETIAYVEWLQRLRMAQGHGRAAVLELPVWLAMAGAYLGQPFSPMLRPDNIRMLVTSYRGDSGPWHDFLHRQALDFNPALLTADALQALGAESNFLSSP
jgi:uncharacterized protein YbjT (DUF2867 family)